MCNTLGGQPLPIHLIHCCKLTGCSDRLSTGGILRKKTNALQLLLLIIFYVLVIVYLDVEVLKCIKPQMSEGLLWMRACMDDIVAWHGAFCVHEERLQLVMKIEDRKPPT